MHAFILSAMLFVFPFSDLQSNGTDPADAPSKAAACSEEKGWTPSMPLECSVTEIKAWAGGVADFSLDAGVGQAHRNYALLGSVTGTKPGTPLPGGTTILPINWDVFTGILLGINPPGFIGSLDGAGASTAQLTFPTLLPGHKHIPLSFAYALQGPPWDYASNAAQILFRVHDNEYKYDDGSSEGFLGWSVGGEICRIHGFEEEAGWKTIVALSVAWGSAMDPDGIPENGAPSTVFLWDDPNDDGDLSDGVLLAKKETWVQNANTDILNVIILDSPVTVDGYFFIGCVLYYPLGNYVMGIDNTGYVTGDAFLGLNDSGVFDYENLANNTIYDLSAIGLGGVFLLRAIPE